MVTVTSHEARPICTGYDDTSPRRQPMSSPFVHRDANRTVSGVRGALAGTARAHGDEQLAVDRGIDSMTELFAALCHVQASLA
ncbi:hypothetical protein GCM10027298_11380 [Epidermidibacterium keratini]